MCIVIDLTVSDALANVCFMGTMAQCLEYVAEHATALGQYRIHNGA